MARLFALALFITFSISATAAACGNPLLWAMLFDRFPVAERVFKAELEARRLGDVRARTYTARPGTPYHVWSFRSLERLARDMNAAVTAELAPEETLTVLVADEVAVVRFTGGAARAEVFSSAAIATLATQSRPSSRSTSIGMLKAASRTSQNHLGSIDVYMTLNALYSGWRHGLTYERMNELGLIFIKDSKKLQIISGVF